MATPNPTSPEAFLLDLFPTAQLLRDARRLGALVRRGGKASVVALVLTVVLTVNGRGKLSIAEMRRELERRTRVLLAASSFWERLSPAFGALVRHMLDPLCRRALAEPPELQGYLAGFKDVIAGDATVVQVNAAHAADWKGTATAAAIKVHTLVRVITGELLRYRITAETKPECRVFGVGHWARDCLFLLDRGYADGSLWWRIHRVGGFFVTRLKTSFSARITATNPGHRGSKTSCIGMKVKDLARTRRGGPIDVQCAFQVRVRPYRKAKGRTFRFEFRVVGLWNRVERRYQLYVTNVSPRRWDGVKVAAAYRLRWEVERFYCCAKTGMGLQALNSKKRHIVELMVRAALLRCTVAMQAKVHAEKTLPKMRWINPLQWIKVWRERLGELLRPWLRGTRPRGRTTWQRLAALAIDPNRKRLSARVLATLGLPWDWSWTRASAR